MSFKLNSKINHLFKGKSKEVASEDQTPERAMEEYFLILTLSKILPLPEWYNDL